MPRFFSWIVLIPVISSLTFSTDAFAQKDPGAIEKTRTKIQKKSSEILEALYLAEPEAKKVVESAYGYATFSNFGMKIFVVGGGKGRGIAVSNQSGDQTYMKMLELQTGIGIGAKKFSLIWVFEDFQSFVSFVDSGWQLGAQASAAVKHKDFGGSYQSAFSVSPGVWLYQLTETGLALEITAKGTKYYRDKKLNSV